MITIDLETHGIQGNPIVLPPRPVGVAIKFDDAPATYLPWDADTVNTLHNIWDGKEDLLFQNGWGFDLQVLKQYAGLEYPDWQRVHDTMYLLFLADPYSPTLSLKPSAERYLGWNVGAKDELQAWVMAHVPEARKAPSKWGAYICEAPFEILSKYGADDADMTRALYNRLSNMQGEAYDRERRIAPVLTDASKRGVRVDTTRLEEDIHRYSGVIKEVEDRLRGIVGDINLNSGAQLADALETAGLVDPNDWVMTAKGSRSTSKDNLAKVIKDHSLLDLLAYQSSLKTCMGTFMEPWLAEANGGDGRVHTTWNQVRNREDGGKGTRTGRISSSGPNLANVSNEFTDPQGNPQAMPVGLPSLPLCRVYLLPEEGHKWLKRDWSGQEFRILAHFEDGSLMESYAQDANYDAHAYGKGEISAITGVDYARKEVKITGFSIIYGSGVPGLSAQLKRPPADAMQIRSAYFRTFPGIEELQRDTKRVGDSGGVITTWGGRQYPVEPPKIINGSLRNFGYKLLNYLIQGSAADQCKQVIGDWYYDIRDPQATLMTQVYDELNISAPAEDWERHMHDLKKAMNQDLFDVPMLSEGGVGDNWAELKECE